MKQSTEIVIIGAGYAGVKAAKKLAKEYKRDKFVNITLVDKNSYHTMLTELHEVAGGRVEPNAVRLDLGRLFNRSKVKLVTATVEHVDYDKKLISTTIGKIAYDHLILGLGAQPNDFGVEGVAENGFTLWSWEDALDIRNHIKSQITLASREQDAKKRRAMMTFAVAGSGFTGVEMIGELYEWRYRLTAEHKLDPDEIQLVLIEAAPTILNMLDRKMADTAAQYMKKKGIDILTSSEIVEVTNEAVILKSGDVVPTHTLIWTAGIQANDDLHGSSVKRGRANRYLVNAHMEADGLEDVYVVGDLAYFEDEAGGANPQIVEAAEHTAIIAAQNIAYKIKGNEKRASYVGKYHGFMVSIGARYGVANLNGLKMKGWLAVLVKHMVNIIHFARIGAWHQINEYMKNEFFHVQDHRQVFRGLLTKYGNLLWSVPLRIFLGFFWLFQGLEKFFGATIWRLSLVNFENIDGLTGSNGLFAAFGHFFSTLGNYGIGADSWLYSETAKMPFHWLSDAYSGATSAATSGATYAAVEWAQPIIYSPPFFMNWIMRVAMPNVSVAVASQRIIVFVQILLGLALIFGLFTWLASLAGTGLLTMLLFTAMLGWGDLWALMASVAILNGAGRTLGLDYYVMPWLKSHLGRWYYGSVKSVYRDKIE